MLFGRRSHSDFTEGLSSAQIANRRGHCVESPSGVLILVGYHELVAVYLHLCVVPMS